MKVKVFLALLIIAVIASAFFIGSILKVANPVAGLAFTLGGTIILVVGYFLGTKKNG